MVADSRSENRYAVTIKARALVPLGLCPLPQRHLLYLQGVYDRSSRTVHLFQRGDRRKKVEANVLSVDDPDLHDVIGQSSLPHPAPLPSPSPALSYSRTAAGEELHSQLMEDIEVLDSLIVPPDVDRIQVRSLVV